MVEYETFRIKEGEEEDGEEEEIDETGYKSIKDAVLFAIDVSQSTTVASTSGKVKGETPESTVSAALKCALSLMQQRIISNPNDMIGILLFGTAESKLYSEDENHKGKPAYPHCYLLTDLGVPTAADVRRLKSMVEDEDEADKILVTSDEPVSMANVLFCASRVFTTKAPNFSSRRLFIVTDNDDPHANDKALRASSTVRAKDLYDLGVIIELFPISTSGHAFDRGKFYDDIIYSIFPNDPEAPAPPSIAQQSPSSGEGISLLKSLLSSINSKAVARRALFSNVPFEIGPGLKISVKGYILFKRQEPARSCYVWLNGEKAQIVKGITTQMADDNAHVVEKGDIKKAYKFGGEQIAFLPEEIKSLRYFGDPVIRIIGFKPMSMLPVWANMKNATFIYPSEEDFVGSTRVFSALQQKLLKDEKMAVAWFIARKNAAPVITAVIPGAEKLGEHGEQVIPPGMWLIPLPFADDIRQNPETILAQAPDSLVDMMRTVVQQLQLPKGQYDPQRYPNPALQWHYRILQAMALEEDLPEQVEDKTSPKYKQIEKRTGEYILEWFKELEGQYQAWQKENGSGLALKRAATGESSLAKRPKVNPNTTAPPLSDYDMRMAFEKDTFGRFTVAMLKVWMEGKGLDTNGRKADLIDKVAQYFEKK
ncbi:MAG: ATP-dependent DNA helicase II subunit 1 [Chaenotheca gracillima]|nr:MAG: ATP-dependent DNA helicase II subunit 1 [Chaenotheca gracillima]